MYRGSRQQLLSIFYASGPSPLSLWKPHVKQGYSRRVLDEDLSAMAMELRSPNVTNCYMSCPPTDMSLGAQQRYLVLLIKNLDKYFTFTVTILDDSGLRRRIRCSNFNSKTKIGNFEVSQPLCLSSGWNHVRLDLAQLTNRAFHSRYVETQKVQVHGNCRIRRIYFCKDLVHDADLPAGFKLEYPQRTVSQRRQPKPPPKPAECPPPSEAGDEEIPSLEEEDFKSDEEEDSVGESELKLSQLGSPEEDDKKLGSLREYLAPGEDDSAHYSQ